VRKSCWRMCSGDWYQRYCADVVVRSRVWEWRRYCPVYFTHYVYIYLRSLSKFVACPRELDNNNVSHDNYAFPNQEYHTSHIFSFLGLISQACELDMVVGVAIQSWPHSRAAGASLLGYEIMPGLATLSPQIDAVGTASWC
jgi:hypothetical protein